MTEYTNNVRQMKADLKTVKYDMTDDMLVPVLLHGLPPNFRDFKEKYDWIRSAKPDDAPELDYLYERLLVEEVKQIRLREERNAKDRAKKKTSGNNNNPSGSTGCNGSQRPKREDRSHLKCTYPGCGKTGHTEDTCWTKDPSKAPRSLKDRLSANTGGKATEGMAGNTETNLTTFRDTHSKGSAGTELVPIMSKLPTLYLTTAFSLYGVEIAAHLAWLRNLQSRCVLFGFPRPGVKLSATLHGNTQDSTYFSSQAVLLSWVVFGRFGVIRRQHYRMV